MSYTPNEIPVARQIASVCMSALFLAWATHGVLIDDLFIPAGQRGGTGSHLHGAAAWIVFAGVVCLAASWLSVVVDHYDTRNNEAAYKDFQKFTLGAALCLVVFAGLTHR